MTETLAYGYSSESAQRELSNEYLHDKDGFQRSLHPCALDESSLSIGRVKIGWVGGWLMYCLIDGPDALDLGFKPATPPRGRGGWGLSFGCFISRYYIAHSIDYIPGKRGIHSIIFKAYPTGWYLVKY